MRVSSRMWKYSWTVVLGTWASDAILLWFRMLALQSAETSRKRLNAGTFRVSPSAAISSRR